MNLGVDLLPDLCDLYGEIVDIAEPVFINYGGRPAFGGEIVTVKAFEDNSLVRHQLEQPGQGKVLVVDGGASMRCAMLGDQLAALAAQNGWEGIVINGCIRDMNAIGATDLGVQALGTHPLKTEKRGLGDVDVAVNFAGLWFRPGAFLYADDNGLLTAPKRLQLQAD